jgi:hypothetical protein
VTVTTVGCADLTPESVHGRIVAMVVMLFRIGFLSVLTATIASRFVKTERGDESEEILAALARLEAELAALKQHFALPNDQASRVKATTARDSRGDARSDLATRQLTPQLRILPRA